MSHPNELLDHLSIAFFQWNSIVSLEERLRTFVSSHSQDEVETFQQDIVRRTFQSDLCKRFPPEPESQIKFLKRFIRVCEDNGHEVLDILYNMVGVLYNENDDQQIFYRSYFFQLISVSLRETKQIISGGTTGLCTWTAGTALARWIGEQKENVFSHKTVIELGAGSGISGIFAIKKWPYLKKYIFSDCHGKVLENLKHNVQKNLVGEGFKFEFGDDTNQCLDGTDSQVIKVMELNWQEVDEEFYQTVDVVLGADIVFDKDLFPSLINTIRIMLRNVNCRAYIACTIRNEETYKIFLSQLDNSPLLWNTKRLYDGGDQVVELIEIYS